MAKPQGKCIFCAGVHLTKEHVFPKWMRPLLDIGLPPVHHRLRIEPLSNPIVGIPIVKPTFSAPEGHIFNKRLRIVCRECNNGWMSDIERRAKPILTELMKGNPYSLDEQQQKDLAIWSAMRVAIWEHDHPASAALTSTAYDHLMRNRTPPAHWSIRISSYQGRSFDLRICHHGFFVGLPELYVEGTITAQKTVIGLKKLLICVISTPLAFSDEAVDRLGASAMQPIWPYCADLTWPTKLVLGDREADQIAGKWG